MLVAVAFLVLIGVVAIGQQGQTAEDERTQLLALLDTECGPDGSLTGGPICVATAPQRAEDATAAATTEGVDAAQVIELIRAEFDARGTDTLTTDEAAAVVRRVLAENPELYRGQPGAGPTQAQVDAALVAAMAADPERYRGRPGVDGSDGESPACLSEPAQCRGTDGSPPVSITQRYADGSSTVCTRDESSPASAPTYTCPPPTGAPDPGGDPDPGAEPGGGGDDPPPPATTEPASPPGGLFG